MMWRLRTAPDFSVALPKGPSYHYPGSEYSPPETTEFAAWVVSDGNGGYKELDGSVTAEDVQNAIVTDEEGKRVAVIKAAFPGGCHRQKRADL